MMGRRSDDIAKRFNAQYSIVPECGCWLWVGTISQAGYGQIKQNYRTRTAHRVSWELHRGDVPYGLFVCHVCDVRSCVNPDHLFLGTCQDNVRDMHDKGRNADRTGEKHPNSKLSERDHAELIRLHREGVTGKDLADRFSLSRGYVSQLVNGIRRNANQRAAERGYGSAA